MESLIGEIKIFPYDHIPVGYISCEGQSLNINEYPKLYMLIGRKFGIEGAQKFKLPDLEKDAPRGITYCIATEGRLPEIHSNNQGRDNY